MFSAEEKIRLTMLLEVMIEADKEQKSGSDVYKPHEVDYDYNHHPQEKS